MSPELKRVGFISIWVIKLLVRYILMLLCLTLSRPAFAQSRITGKVESAGKPVAFANVLLLSSQDSSLVKGMLTSESGDYVLDLVKPGQYLLQASMIGYRKAYSPVFLVTATQSAVAVNTLKLEQDSKNLTEVSVNAQKPLFEQQLDRMVVNVQSSITAAASTALQVLERLPGVLIDHYNNALSLSGKNGVQVMINGKLSRMPMEAVYQLLSSMPANNIIQIELITTPPANLDAEGNAGYINIVLRKNEADGLNGSVFLNAETRRRFSNALGTDINFRKNKISLFANYAYTFDRRMIYAYIDRQIIRPDYSLDFRSKVSRKSGVGVHNFRMALDYQLSNRTVIGFLTTVFDRNWAQTTDIQADFKPSTGPDSLMHGQRWDKNLSEQYMGNVNLRHNFTDKQQLNLDLDYFYYHASQPQNYVFDYFTEGTLIRQNQIRIDKNTPMHIWVAKTDYNWQPATGLSIETGVKATYSNFANSVFRENKNGSEWFRDPVFSEKTSMDEMIGAAFGSVTYKINQTTDFKAGLRYEYTNTELLSEKSAPISRKYGSLFPVLYFSKKLNEQQTWQFSYNRRLTRPAFSELAPYVAYLDPVTYVTGNAFLWPSFTNALKTDFSHKGIIFSLQASRTKNAIYSHQPQANAQNNIIIYSSQNIDQEDNYTFSLTLPLTITPNWEAQNNLLAMRQQVKTQIAEAPFKFARSSFSFNSSHTFKLPKMYSVELSGFYNSPTILGIKRVRAMSALNIGFRKELNNNWGRLNLSFSDSFRKNLWLWETNLPQQGLSESLTFDLDTRSLKLTYTKNFGNQKVKGAQKRATGSAEEQKRL